MASEDIVYSAVAVADVNVSLCYPCQWQRQTSLIFSFTSLAHVPSEYCLLLTVDGEMSTCEQENMLFIVKTNAENANTLARVVMVVARMNNYSLTHSTSFLILELSFSFYFVNGC